MARFKYGWLDSICGGVPSESGDPPVVVSGSNASPYSNAFDINLLIAPKYASPSSCLKMNLERLHQPGASLGAWCAVRDGILTSIDSERVRTSSLDRNPSLFLSWMLKNHSMLSIKSLNITPSSPETMS